MLPIGCCRGAWGASGWGLTFWGGKSTNDNQGNGTNPPRSPRWGASLPPLGTKARLTLRSLQARLCR